MHFFKFALAACLTVSTLGVTLAALPPQYQRMKELRAILDDDAITGKFDVRHPIDKIEHVEHDLYRITGGGCTMDVAIETDAAVKHPPGWAGARQFVLAPRPLVCR